MNNNSCPVCKNIMSEGKQSWHLMCLSCKYEAAFLLPSINSESAHDLVNEDARQNGLKKLRIGNFEQLLKHIKIHSTHGKTLLEVGSAHGWFLNKAKEDFTVLGIEPDKIICNTAQVSDLRVRCGYFPDVLNSDETFDIIIFNDVIEHIPNVSDVLHQCYKHLNPEGLLVLNLPSSKGFFYKVSKWLLNFKVIKPFERMWQKSLPSPHLHYFNSENLTNLLLSCGFKIKSSGNLPTIRLSGLYSRVTYAEKSHSIIHFFIYCIIVIFLPFLRILPNDIIYIISQRKES